MQNLEELRKLIKPLTLDNSISGDMLEYETNNFSKFKVFPVNILVKADWNYKEDDEFISEKLIANLKRNGQVENIQVRELPTGYFEVVNGNHRLDAIKALGKNFVVAYDHGIITSSEAKRIAVETNETHFNANFDKLSALLQELKTDFSDLELTMPFTEDRLKELIGDSLTIPNEYLNNIEEDNFEGVIPERPKTLHGDLLNGNEINSSHFEKDAE